MASSVAVRVLGSGPAVMLVHGAVASGPTWKAQEDLATRWRLVIVTRRGFRPSPAADRQDFAADARDLEKLLRREPAHCVGFDYGAIGLAVLAGAVPELLRSLTLIEPPRLAAAPAAGDPGAAQVRPASEADPDLAAVAAAGVPSLVLSGDHDPEMEAASDSVAERLGSQRDRLPGAGHAVQRAPVFNRRLERFLFGAETSRL
jgi:pimeloyl-ACP methyl ester carboxylesterase